MALALDTLEYARRLRQAGFTEQQAEGQARALAATMTDSLATKDDLRESARSIEQRFDPLEKRLDALEKRLDALERRLDALEQRFEIRLEELEKRLEIRMNELEQRFEAKLATGLAGFRTEIVALEGRLVRQLGAMMLAGIALVSTLVKIL